MGTSDKKKEGLYKTYHKNGQLESEGNYVDGRMDGLWKFYHENGQLKLEGNFNDGELK